MRLFEMSIYEDVDLEENIDNINMTFAQFDDISPPNTLFEIIAFGLQQARESTKTVVEEVFMDYQQLFHYSQVLFDRAEELQAKNPCNPNKMKKIHYAIMDIKDCAKKYNAQSIEMFEQSEAFRNAKHVDNTYCVICNMTQHWNSPCLHVLFRFKPYNIFLDA
jgi:hypothetical protein